MKRSRHPVYFYLFLGIVSICIYLFFHIVLKVGEDAEKAADVEKLDFIDKFPVNYSKALLGLHDLKLEGSMYSKTRDPISAFLYNSNTELIIYKLPINANRPLTDIIKEAFVSSSLLDNNHYWVFSSNHFSDEGKPSYQILYKHGLPKIGEEIYFKLSGTNSRITSKNDSVATYSSNLINFSIGYNNDNIVDLYGKNESSANLKPVQIQFKKYDDDVYVLIFFPK